MSRVFLQIRSLIDLFACCKNKQTFLAFVPINIMHSHRIYFIIQEIRSRSPRKNIIIIVAEKPKVSYLPHFSIKYITHTLIGLLIFQLLLFIFQIYEYFTYLIFEILLKKDINFTNISKNFFEKCSNSYKNYRKNFYQGSI